MPQAVDPFRITNKLETSARDVIVARLETGGHHPRFAKPLSDYLDRMDIDGKANILDLGRGTGIVARAIAQRPGFKGSILGIDLSDHHIQAAHRFAAEQRLGDRVRFETGDSHTLGLAPCAFDAVVAHSLFSHLDDAAQVLTEMRRVLRSEGLVSIVDGDYASMTFELADEARSRRMDDAIIGSLMTSPRVLPRLPRQLKKAGFAVAVVMPSIITDMATPTSLTKGY